MATHSAHCGKMSHLYTNHRRGDSHEALIRPLCMGMDEPNVAFYDHLKVTFLKRRETGLYLYLDSVKFHYFKLSWILMVED